jgi:DNA polymerase III delta prime subunit
MNPREYMIVDLLRRGNPKMFITERVDDVKTEKGMYKVSFSGKSRPYTYRRERLQVLSNPEKVELQGRGLYIRKKHITDAVEVYRFGSDDYTFWYIICESGYYLNEDGRNVYLSRTSINLTNTNLWEYLNHVISETGLELKPKDADEPINILQLQYNLVDVNRDTVPLAQYLGGKDRLRKFNLPKCVIYPFGCNASQKKAVENALTNQVSIIQGPPGTGKTQTILNIIANLLIKGKTILVVSNNNSVVDNVAEKLSFSKVGLGFIVVKLGSRESRAMFIENQPAYPDMSDWLRESKGEIVHKVDDALDIVSEGFAKQIELSQLSSELSSLDIEQKYNNDMTISQQHAISWLNGKPSAKLIKLLLQFQHLVDEGQKMSLMHRLKWVLALGLKAWSMLKRDNAVNLVDLEVAYYSVCKKELEIAIEDKSAFLKRNNANKNMDILCEQSLILLKDSIARRYQGGERTIFKRNTIKQDSENFLREYPVVLSTTSSAKSCISKDMIFDYVIMDEASQVDIATGALALSCAENAVIVGDDKQLPNVIDGKTRLALTDIENAHGIDDKYKITTHSFLQSCNEVFTDCPTTLLREHYRCQPKIIEFCNQMFYDGELITMTKDDRNGDTLSVVRTVPGNHARGHVNQREIDVIAKEVLPDIPPDESMGIISPYRDQSFAINEQLHQDIASTVHKYQGRECDTIIMSMVDNEPTSFSDDANLLNVAISRAKSKLCIVVTGNELPEKSILSQLIGYIKYNNFETRDSQLHSVFDILYKQYTRQRLEYEKTKGTDLGELSENVIFDTLEKAISSSALKNIAILCHYPLSRLIAGGHDLSDGERKFINSPLSHVDFLLYNTITKRPLLCIEVDGWQFHHTEVQKHRDAIKNEILDKYGLKLVRLSTISVVTINTIKNILIETLKSKA